MKCYTTPFNTLSSLQGVCADQSKVCGYHRFQQAEFSQSVLAELRRLFEARTELLHQKVALHAYTALLSRLQVESYLYRLLKGEGLTNFTCFELAMINVNLVEHQHMIHTIHLNDSVHVR